MSSKIVKFHQLLDYYERVLEAIITTIILVMIATVTYQVMGRYLPQIPRFLWTEEISRYGFIWMVMIGATLGVRRFDHFNLEIFQDKLSPRARRFAFIFIDLSILTVCLFFAIKGWEFVESGFLRRSLASKIPMAWIYGSLWFAGINMSLFAVERIIKSVELLFLGQNEEEVSEHDDGSNR